MTMRVGADVGGTFIDVVAVDGSTGEIHTEKQPATPDRLAEELLVAMARLPGGVGAVSELLHGEPRAPGSRRLVRLRRCRAHRAGHRSPRFGRPATGAGGRLPDLRRGSMAVGSARGRPVRVHGCAPGRGRGTPGLDGPTLIFVGDGDTRNTPVEVIEHRFPLRVERHALLPGFGGRGRFTGGPGVARDYRILEPGIMLQFTNENVRDPIARGRDGGEPGRAGELVLDPGTDREITIHDRVTSYGPLPVGTVVSARSGGGGGYGSVPGVTD